MFREFVDEHKAEMIESLQELLRIESVSGSSSEGKPFGDGPASALDYVLSWARKRGFDVKNVDGFAGHVEYGMGEEYIAVLSHLDVVPAGSGWTFPAFAAQIHDGKVYARGAIDDKGPAMSVLWALEALKASGLKTNRKIRLIFGLDEETEWRCMDHYLSKEPVPLGGFTPDADFPLTYAEKGLLTIRVSVKADEESMSPLVVQFEGGSRFNMVPDTAYAVVDCHSEIAAAELAQKLLREGHQRQIKVDVSVNGSRLQIMVHGVSAHGSTPDAGENAIVGLATLLSIHHMSNSSMWRAIAAQDTGGSALGIDSSDPVTGPLTSNLGVGRLENNTYDFWFNIRYPIDLTETEILSTCRQYVSDKWEVHVEESKTPLYVAPDSPVVKVLSRVYETYVDGPAELLTMGGATYARTIPNAVAFGPLFPGIRDTAHQVDECWAIEDYLRCIQIYAHAMWDLANTV